MLIRIAGKSLWNRRGTMLLTFLSLLISLTLLFSIEHIRQQSKESFQSAISGADLIVGGRSGQLNLLLYSVFRVGTPTSAVSWQSYEQISGHPRVSWSIPISLGDSHQGYSVIGTNLSYFEHFRYGRQQPLRFAAGEAFTHERSAVLGSEVAKALGYKLGDRITFAHGAGGLSFSEHADHPFTVEGILAPTGTPVDQSVHVPFLGLDQIHSSHATTASNLESPSPQTESTAGDGHDHDHEHDHDHHTHAHDHPDPIQENHSSESVSAHFDAYQPRAINAFFVGIDMRAATLILQRYVNTFDAEPLTAIIPGVAMTELWKTLAMFENVLRIISFLVLIAALIGLATTLLAAMKEREREIAILRATGARPIAIFSLILVEVLGLVISAVVSSFALIWLALMSAQQWLVENYGILINTNPLNSQVLLFAGIATILAIVVSLIPASKAYRVALTQGLTPRI